MLSIVGDETLSGLKLFQLACCHNISFHCR